MSWHPSLVHFPIGVWLVGNLLLMLALAPKLRWLRPYAWSALVLGGLSTIAAVASGQSAFQALEFVPEGLRRHRQLSNAIPWAIVIVMLARGHAYLRRWSLPTWLWSLPISAISGALLLTANWGSKAVFLS